MSWTSGGVEGLLQSGSGEEESFTPLYEIEKIRGPRNRRDSGPPDAGGDRYASVNTSTNEASHIYPHRRWDVINVPWGPLDDDGEEEMETRVCVLRQVPI